jgi:hypothetical protein
VQFQGRAKVLLTYTIRHLFSPQSPAKASS